MGRKSKTDVETGQRQCSTCKQVLPVSAFYFSTRRGYQSHCKNCSKQSVLAWQKRFPDRANIKSNEWKKGHRDQVLTNGAAYREKNRDRLRKQNSEWARQHRAAMSPEERHQYYRRADLNRKYGITVEWYDSKLIAQDGRCAICNDPVGSERALAVDHCHKTLKNRGLLCGHCNPLLHKLEADSDWMDKAVQYLNFSKEIDNAY